MARRIVILVFCLILLTGCAVPQLPATSVPTAECSSTTAAIATETVTLATTAPESTPSETMVVETSAPTIPAVIPNVDVTARFDPYALVDTMTTAQLVGQLFLARYPGVESLAVSHQEKYNLGGYILFSVDFENQTKQSISKRIQTLQDAADIPLLIAVDEEGGTVTRVSRFTQFRETPFQSPRKLYTAGGVALLTQTEAEKCALLGSIGINVNMAPVCDITTDPTAFMYKRSLGLSPTVTGVVIASMVNIMDDHKIGSVLKHFPGYGNNKDTHIGIAVDDRTLTQLEQADLVPFRSGIFVGCDAILLSHTIVNGLDSEMPASLSPAVVAYLRQTMGFDGVIVTDDLVMEAITDLYGTKEAAILAVLAGCDLLCSSEYGAQYEAVLSAVESGRIPMQAIRDAAARILLWKHDLGLLPKDGNA